MVARVGRFGPYVQLGDGDDASENDLAITVVNYAFLDTHQGVLSIDAPVLNEIETEYTFSIRPTRRHSVVVWRSGDEIFLAPTSEEPESLTARISVD